MNTLTFDDLLASTLRERVRPTTPRGLAQRLTARITQATAQYSAVPTSTSKEPDFLLHPAVPTSTSKGHDFSRAIKGQLENWASAPEVPFHGRLFETAKPKRSTNSLCFALTAHAAVLLLVFGVMRTHLQLAAPLHKTSIALTAPPPQLPPRAALAGGGGGAHDNAPVVQGHPPQIAQQQILPPKAPPTIAPKLAVQPTIVVDMKLADNALPNMGSPNSTLKGFSLGNGSGGGLGSGDGNGIGPGSGGNTGGGVYHVGEGVSEPIVLHSVDPEFSEEARKAKFSGNVEIYLLIDAQGNPQHVRCARDIGMGLCDKAIAAVRQYKFKPSLRDGKPVTVDMYIDVNFQIF